VAMWLASVAAGLTRTHNVKTLSCAARIVMHVAFYRRG
jgi:hypothetical protein